MELHYMAILGQIYYETMQLFKYMISIYLI